MNITQHQERINGEGYTVIADVFDNTAMDAMVAAINEADPAGPLFRKTNDLFAIRRFLQAVPAIQPLVFTERLQVLLQQLFGAGYFPVKSIYFDKPGQSNWFVAWHQDLRAANATPAH
jgi:ectoine hydroxylase-related dioxygenase (phytanoyl-CoA dioxygenase family)